MFMNKYVHQNNKYNCIIGLFIETDTPSFKITSEINV